jgi:FkbM family methyltransferase
MVALQKNNTILQKAWKPFSMLATLIKEARRSPFPSWRDKCRVFATLLSLQWHYSWYKKRRSPVVHSVLGYTIHANDYSTLLFLFREIFLVNSYQFNTQTEQPVILDCGANIGMAVLYFKYLYPQAQITAFEPNPSAFRLLEKNIRDNALSNVSIVHVGLSDRVGKMRFFTGDGGASLVGSLREDRAQGKEIEIETQLLSDYMRTCQPDCVKIDVEGAETLILKDLVATGTLDIPKHYLIEYHHQIGGEAANLSAFLLPFEQAGYDYKITTFDAPDDLFQDILLHFYKR